MDAAPAAAAAAAASDDDGDGDAGWRQTAVTIQAGACTAAARSRVIDGPLRTKTTAST